MPFKQPVIPAALTDQQLLALMRKDDRAAFTELYNRYWDKIFVVAVKRLGDEDAAGELVQDVFLSLWLRRAELNIAGNLSAYLAVAVKYKVIDHLAAQYKRQQQMETLSGESPAFVDSINERMDAKELNDQLQTAISRLPEKCRIVFLKSREEQKTYAEIAVELGIAEKTVEAHMSKALTTLRQTLKISLPILFSLLK